MAPDFVLMIHADAVCAHMDMDPAILDNAGVRMPNRPVIDGVSLTPLCRQGGKRGAPTDGGDRRFDVYADPAEKTSLAAKMPDQVAKLRQAMEQWQRSVRASFDDNDYAER